MDLRQLRHFIAVAEELHFARAAQRLHIEQSPLSRSIKDLEGNLGVELLHRTTRTTKLTPSGTVLLTHARRLMTLLRQAEDSVRAAASGYHGFLRIGAGDEVAQIRLANLLATSRTEAPDVGLQLCQASLTQLARGLLDECIDVAFVVDRVEVPELICDPIWYDPWTALLPTGHPLAARHAVKLAEVVSHDLVLVHPDPAIHAGQIDELLRRFTCSPLRVTPAGSQGVMATMVAAGFGIGFAGSLQSRALRRPDVVVVPIADTDVHQTTYLLRREGAMAQPLKDFIHRAGPSK